MSYAPSNTSLGDLSPQEAAESRVPQILVGTIAPFIFGTVFVFARFYSRGIVLRSWGQDDWWMSLSWVITVALTVMHCTSTMYGAGRHVQVIKPSWLEPSLLWAWIERILYQIVICTTKIGLCTFNLRVFTDKTSRGFMFLSIIFIALYTIAVVISVILQCAPLSGSYNITQKPPPKCTSITPGIIASAVCNIATDILLMGFITYRIIPLNMAQRQKFWLYFIISLSILMIVAATIRLVRSLALVTSQDKSWDSSDILTWTAIEVNVGLFCTSAPAIKPIIRRFLPGFITSTPCTTAATDGRHEASSHNRYRMSVYARSKQMNQSMELRSQEGLEMGDFNQKPASASWARDDDSIERDGDSESVKRVLGLQNTIVKTTRISLSDGGGRAISGDINYGIETFKHV